MKSPIFAQSESSMETSPEVSGKPCVQEVRGVILVKIHRGFCFSDVNSSLLFQADRPPSLVSSPCTRNPTSETLAAEVKLSVPESPQPPPAESEDSSEDRTEGGVTEGTSEPSTCVETCASSYPGWIKSPERGSTGPAGLNFSPVNSNLRDLTPSHTLEPLSSPFRHEAAAGATAGTGSQAPSQPQFSESQGQLFYPCLEEGSILNVSRSLNGDGSGEGGSAQNPPQKKKVSFWKGGYALHSARERNHVVCAL